ncbi:ribosome biogenesis GTPase YlqF [Hydrogenibacillus sp. N12]|uniref:ribosome biogenesis GTPase YlqF n=1 Tax=Hydrogenibacillus sp. N12 TaxID=2866627 RepID=UPI001C7DE8BC|nr:ribosome biogenesis GTPase YlqF [Hydrogenibacillus sp. N12]QZA33477.1 ribosome biogenesis GTPase YlqF [Hydrogenibacillus sp. N12]
MSIQWFPGHMAKAERELRARLELVDAVFELRDARAPRATANPRLPELLGGRRRIIVLAKADQADPAVTQAWLEALRRAADAAVAVDLVRGAGLGPLYAALERLGRDVAARRRARGLLPRPPRAMVVGVPNVGKSTFINRLAGRRAAKVGDRPGVTRGLVWIRARGGVELLDTPGLLWPKLDDPEGALLLAALGAVAEHRFQAEAVAAFLYRRLADLKPAALLARYGAVLSAGGPSAPASAGEDEPGVALEGDPLSGGTALGGGAFGAAGLPEPAVFLARLAAARGLLRPGGAADAAAAAELFLREVRSGALGPVSFEAP